MSKQEMKPPEAWNDKKAIRESFRLWFGWYGWKGARASFGAFRRGYISGAIAASIGMWEWIQGAVFGQETEEREERAAGPEEDLSMMTEREQKALNMIMEISDWLSGTAEATATGQPGAVLLNACETGTKYLESIGEYLKDGRVPKWYED